MEEKSYIQTKIFIYLQIPAKWSQVWGIEWGRFILKNKKALSKIPMIVLSIFFIPT